MKTKKKAFSLIGLAAALAVIFFLAYRKGQDKGVYAIRPIPRLVPIPIIYDQFSGLAAFPDEFEGKKARVRWSYASLPKEIKDSYLTCLGWYPVPAGKRAYLLRLDDRIYVEKGDLVEPLIRGVYEMANGLPADSTHGMTIDEVITDMPQDRALLAEIITRFPKNQVKGGS